MPLDLSELSRQAREMSSALNREAPDYAQRCVQALERYLRSSEPAEPRESSAHAMWAQAVDLSRDGCVWLLARPVEPLNTVRDAPPRPPDYAVIATDGSHIDIDRHGAALCYVLNIGRVYLRYGASPAAKLAAHPTLCFREEDLYLTDGMRRIPIEGNYLSARRDVAEGTELVSLAKEFLTADDIPALALQDGTLVRWTLAGAEKAVLEHFLRPYLTYLDEMRACRIPVASYISRPRSPEVAGMIRLMFCPDVNLEQQRGAKCNACSDAAAGRTPSCFVCHGLSDADILAYMLDEGQRGPLFASMSRVNVESYGAHLIHFFYMRVGREIARVEMPRWVAEDAELLDRVHALVYDQCLKGQGYPVALARAHEQAVIRTADRRAFERIVERSLIHGKEEQVSEGAGPRGRAETRSFPAATSSRKAASKKRQSV